ncbi:hypothetical protein ASF66_00955 [Pseudomonas sp. Leaf129]|uniref:hypothetical protein n=1 Tax=Pseudomonas sp. Leaf129 TaxID=1736268 RepID=UPI000702F685|nr:hypothetical protein [Pseudomonas sp. Leaf129]KQQ62954.1 hypothetical protein ASF66_00955 [Pseudomonas sp. Leaf129]
MIDPRRVFVTEVALSMLEQWYTTWEGFRSHKDSTIRRLALHAKTRGLVCHDRTLAKSEVVIND